MSVHVWAVRTQSQQGVACVIIYPWQLLLLRTSAFELTVVAQLGAG